MFSKGKKGSGYEGESSTPLKVAVPSIISTDMKIIGNVISEGEIQIDGQIEGDIKCNNLLVGEPASIKGEIVVDSIEVFGTIVGQIKANSVTLAKTAHVVGDILHEFLAIEKGAFLGGHCKRMPDKQGNPDRISLVREAGNETAKEPVAPAPKEKGANST
jgi:cytoskeletal protein CcmA (bactofilin family)